VGYDANIVQDQILTSRQGPDVALRDAGLFEVPLDVSVSTPTETWFSMTRGRRDSVTFLFFLPFKDSLDAEPEDVARAPPLRRLWAFDLLVSCLIMSLRPRAVV
jgi:hypothetical protein